MCDVRVCRNESTFWVQSIPTTHNSTVCAIHLVATIREIVDKSTHAIDEKAPLYMREDIPHPEYWRSGPDTMYARVTVKTRVGEWGWQ